MSYKRILLVEDDQTLGYILKEYLQMNEYSVIWASDGVKGLEMFKSHPFDIIVLDIMMPYKDGFELAQEVKELMPDIPLLFLTAKSLKIDKLKGFSLGADDYVIKPVDEEELLARINAILKRSSSKSDLNKNIEYKVGNFDFDYSKRLLKNNKKTYHLTGKEAELFKMLVINKNKLVDRHQTLKKIWGRNDYFNRRTMDVHLSHLRKIIKSDPSLKIINVHNKGFILEEVPFY